MWGAGVTVGRLTHCATNPVSASMALGYLLVIFDDSHTRKLFSSIISMSSTESGT